MKWIEEIQVKVDNSDSEFLFASFTSIPGPDTTQEVPYTPHQMRLNVIVVKLVHSKKPFSSKMVEMQFSAWIKKTSTRT